MHVVRQTAELVWVRLQAGPLACSEVDNHAMPVSADLSQFKHIRRHSGRVMQDVIP